MVTMAGPSSFVSKISHVTSSSNMSRIKIQDRFMISNYRSIRLTSDSASSA